MTTSIGSFFTIGNGSGWVKTTNSTGGTVLVVWSLIH